MKKCAGEKQTRHKNENEAMKHKRPTNNPKGVQKTKRYGFINQKAAL